MSADDVNMTNLPAHSIMGRTCCVSVILIYVPFLQGSFSKGAFAAYNVYEREVELSEVPNDAMENG